MELDVGKSKARGMWVDKYRPKKFSDLLGEDVSTLPFSLPEYQEWSTDIATRGCIGTS